MRILTTIVAMLLVTSSCTRKANLAQVPSMNLEFDEKLHQKDVLAFQKELNKDYSTPEDSPLPDEKIESFKKKGGHQFFPINSKFRIVADFNTDIEHTTINFETTTDRIAVYDLFGIATFNIDDKTYRVNVYQSHKLREKEEYKDHLFLPYTDLTSGTESYGGGRFLDLTIPAGDKILIDFNKSYNPYCAYSDKYSCPIPPIENAIDCMIKAGVSFENKH